MLARKYGYEPIDTTSCSIMQQKKDPRQIWYGIEPGSLVNLEEKIVFRSGIFTETDKPVMQQQLEN